MRRFMDCLFRGIIKIINKNPNIQLIVLDKGQERDNKNFAIRVLSNGRTANRIVLQSLNGTDVKDWLTEIDWETGTLNHPYLFKCGGAGLSYNTNPTPVKGGLYFNTGVNKWYKCDDGVNWVLANI